MTAPESPAQFLLRAADGLGPAPVGPVSDKLAALLRTIAGCGCTEDSDHWAEKAAALSVAAAVLGENWPPVPAGEPAEFTLRPAAVRAVVGANLRRLRRERKWTLEFVAAKAGVSDNTLWSLERGLRGGGLYTALAIASVYGVTLDELVTSPEVSRG